MSLVFLVALLVQSGDYAPALKATADVQSREAQLREVASVGKRSTPSIAEDGFRTCREETLEARFWNKGRGLFRF